MEKLNETSVDPEIDAISIVYSALKGLETNAQFRVLKFVSDKLGIQAPVSASDTQDRAHADIQTANVHEAEAETNPGQKDSDDAGIEGISGIAKKWITRNGFRTTELSNVFSLGIDDIDVISKTIPGSNKKEKMHNVFLLKGISAYLGGGVARFSHQQIKETCLHYDAYDANNFASYLKALAGDISGSKESGYILTARGMTNAGELLKQMFKDEKK